jgi:PAS domain S-box-containing protein
MPGRAGGTRGSDRYHTFLSLSGDGVVRMELVPPLDAGAPEEEQLVHILRHGRVAECNELFARFYGRDDPRQMVGLAMGDFVPAGEPARLHGIREFIRAGYRLVYVEEEHALAEGGSRWISASALGATQAGRLHEFWVCLREITERKRAELDRERRGRILEAVAFSAARLLRPGDWRAQVDEALARLGEAAQVARAWIGQRERHPDGSERFCFRFSWGVPEAAVSTADPRIAAGLSLQAPGFERLAAELRAGRHVALAVRQLSEDERQLPEQMGSKAFAIVPIFADAEWWGALAFGETRYAREWSGPEIEALKAAAAVLGAAIERERADAALRTLETELRLAAEQWRQTFDALDLGIVIADAEGRIVRLNRGALQAPARGFAGTLGRRLDELAAQEPWRALLDLHRRVGESRASVVAEAREPSSGRAYYLLASPWLRAEGESPWRVMTFRDVTEFTQVQEQLRQARVMEAMGALVAGVAHEVRNPLFSISATVDSLEARIGGNAEFAELAGLLRSQVRRLTQLTRDLLEYGRPQALRRTPTSLAAVLRRAVRACSTLARERKVTIEEALPASLPQAQLDGGQMEQALENLLANAIQHAPEGSAVKVTGRLEPQEPDSWLCCSVEDQGPGLPADGLERIFEPFFTRRKGGTGLGLSIVQRVVEAHGGRVSAENREGGGARFTVRLPLGPELGEGARG